MLQVNKIMVIGQSGGGGSLSMSHSGGSALSMYGSSSSVAGIENQIHFDISQIRSQVYMLNVGSSSSGIGQSEGGGSINLGHSGGSALSMYGSSSSVTGIVNQTHSYRFPDIYAKRWKQLT